MYVCRTHHAMMLMLMLVTLIAVGGCVNYREAATQNALKEIEIKTGLKPIDIPGTGGEYLGKQHRGYNVLYTGKAGNVWGRYAFRLTMSEISREVDGIMAFLTGTYKHGGNVTGSPLDRLLSRTIGQPLITTMILVHEKHDAKRLDITSQYSNVKPEDPQPKFAYLGIGAGTIFSADQQLAGRLQTNQALMKRLKNLRGAYIRVDGDTVSFLWAGHERDFSHMINDHGGYHKMLNAFLDNLADIADAI